MTNISLWDPDHVWVSCKNCGQWHEEPIFSVGSVEVCSNCRRPIEIPVTGRGQAVNSVVDEAAITRTRTDSSGTFFFLCPNCNRRFSLPNRAEGFFAKCSRCGLIIMVQRVIGTSESAFLESDPTTERGETRPTGDQRCDVVLDRSKQDELSVKGIGQEKCSYCEGEFDGTERDYFCPECCLRFHEQCWIENQGCAAPGCKSQHVLKGPETIKIPSPPGHSPGVSQAETAQTPWEYALLLGTVILGIVSFMTTLWLNVIGVVLSLIALKNDDLRKGRAAVVKACMTVAIVSFLFSAVIRSN
jgi:hypothetical protein